MTKIWDFICAHPLGIYVAGVLVVSFLGGYVDPEDPKDHKGQPSVRADVVFVSGMWPIFAVIAALSSPIWVPMVFAEFGAWLAKRREQKETAQRALDYAKLTKKEPGQ